ncbi:hypothetical protein [Pantoea rwandensis]|uniref:GAPS4 PD-(D/E)XK nuclease domain-containing protein n=1 Tax=Pantoea rwandensis TaxID=1076550 RepID=A0ABM5RJE3_9GAMM|nr:hypothetical protein [Pantoea rwandensis]AIR86017.1 hypothetical protein LH22_11295 [Pantoea rwandensis]
MAENGPIEELAKIVSSKIFERFKWKISGPFDQDFACIDEDNHKPIDKKQAHTHPVDVVFSYKDPYLNKTILLNTDLKSYAKGSINVDMIEGALSSLGETISCARYSSQWREKYNICAGDSEVRGLLFVYNHDNDFEHNFYNFFDPPPPKGRGKRPKSIKLDNINISEGQQLHIIEPKTISYMLSIIADMNELVRDNQFPREEYGFYYPQLVYHKVVVTDDYFPATVESLTAPFLIIKHDAVYSFNRETQKEFECYPPGYIVYYNRPGSSDMEFYYLLDLLSNYQILNGKNNIRIRIATSDRNDSIRSHFQRALEKYALDWNYDESAKQKLLAMELHLVPTVKEFYSSEAMSWER